MKIWKIEHTNKSTDGVKIAVSISSSESKGIILNPGQFVLAQEQQTASLDSQTRRGFVKVDSFDNALYLTLGEVYNTSILIQPEPVVDTITTEEDVVLSETTEDEEKETLSKLQEAEKDASDYINKEEE